MFWVYSPRLFLMYIVTKIELYGICFDIRYQISIDRVGHLSMTANICPPFNQICNTGYFFSGCEVVSSESSFPLKGHYHLSLFSFRDSWCWIVLRNALTCSLWLIPTGSQKYHWPAAFSQANYCLVQGPRFLHVWNQKFGQQFPEIPSALNDTLA